MTEFNLDRVAGELNSLGVAAVVEQTGGGTATLFAGERYFNRDGEPCWQICAGPGWFEEPGYGSARADAADFSVGPDDHGATAGVTVIEEATPTQTEDAIAELIAKQVQDFTWPAGAYQRADGHWGERDVLNDERRRTVERVRTARRNGHVAA